jgi:hypothetical protein
MDGRETTVQTSGAATVGALVRLVRGTIGRFLSGLDP